MNPTFKQDPLPHCTPKEKMALDSNYYPHGYIPEEQEKYDAPLLVNNLITPWEKALLEEQDKDDAPLLMNPAEKNTQEDLTEDEEKDSIDNSRPMTGCR